MADQLEEEPWDLLAEALVSFDDGDEPEIDPVLDVREAFEGGEAGDGLTKVPLAQAANLLKVRRAVQALKDATMSKQDFLNSMRPLGRSLENGLKLVDSPPIQKQISELPPDERELFEDAQHSIRGLYEGINHMMRYQESDKIADVDEGLRMVEESFAVLDEVQDDAIEMSRSDKDSDE